MLYTIVCVALTSTGREGERERERGGERERARERERERGRGREREIHYTGMDNWGQDYKEKHKLDSKQISNSPC